MLIIVESPAKAKTIGKILGSKYTVKASAGHIRQISDTNTTADGRKLEISGIDIDNHFQPIFEISNDKKKIVSEIKQLAKAAKDGILFATDSDREGEAISWHLAEVLGIKDKSKVQRLEFHEITEKAIKQAIANPRQLNLKLVEAQQTRQILDKLVGYKLSPVLWSVMGNYKLSAGRVQSPTLRLICEREKEIQAFVSEEYWEIKGIFEATKKVSNPTFRWHTKENALDTEKEGETNWFRLNKVKGEKLPEKINSKENLINLLDGLDCISEYTVCGVSQKTEKSYTKPPFTTSTLQQSASSKLGYSPKMTMQIAQKLYEGVEIDGSPTALITYMRTDSTNLSDDSIQACREFIAQNYPQYLPPKAKFYQSKSRNAQEAHEAIRPTDPLITPASLKGKLDQQQWKLYDLIWKQTIACQMTDEIRQRVTFVLQNNRQDEFTGFITWTTHLGFKAIMDDSLTEEKEGKSLLRQGDKMYLQEIFCFQKFTQPPTRYSPASLVKKMEELGIGRPSTYATIISTLYERGYVQENNKTLIPTSLGMKINEILTTTFTQVTSSEMTAKMEDDLDRISKGEIDYETVLNDFWWDFKKLVDSKSETLKRDRQKYRDTETEVRCPKYGDKMILKIGKFGEYYQNPNHPECIYPKNFKEYEAALKEAQAKFGNLAEGLFCEECGKPLIVRVSKTTLKPYIACPDYKIGNKHTIKSIASLQVGESNKLPTGFKAKSNSRKKKE